MTDDKEIRGPETELPEPLEKSGQKKFGRWVLGLGAAAVVAALSFFFLINGADRESVENSRPFSGQVIFAVPERKEIRFDDFLVPLEADTAHTAMSFSVVIRFRDSDWLNISGQEKTWLRAMIYDTLAKEMKKLEKPPSVDTVALWVNRTVREMFPDKRFDQVMVDNVFIL